MHKFFAEMSRKWSCVVKDEMNKMIYFQEMKDLVSIIVKYLGDGQKLICYQEFPFGYIELTSVELVASPSGLLIPAFSNRSKTIVAPPFHVQEMIVHGSNLFLRGNEDILDLGTGTTFDLWRDPWWCIIFNDHLLFSSPNSSLLAALHIPSKQFLTDKEVEIMLLPKKAEMIVHGVSHNLIHSSCLTSTGLWLRGLSPAFNIYLWKILCFDTVRRVHSILQISTFTVTFHSVLSAHFMLSISNGLVLLVGQRYDRVSCLVLDPISCSLSHIPQEVIPEDIHPASFSFSLVLNQVTTAKVLDSPDGGDQILLLCWGANDQMDGFLSARIHTSPLQLGSWRFTRFASPPLHVNLCVVEDDDPIFQTLPGTIFLESD